MHWPVHVGAIVLGGTWCQVSAVEVKGQYIALPGASFQIGISRIRQALPLK